MKMNVYLPKMFKFAYIKNEIWILDGVLKCKSKVRDIVEYSWELDQKI